MQRRTFVSGHDGTAQEYLIEVPEARRARAVVIYLHGATNHLDQGMDDVIFEGTFGFMKAWARGRGCAYACPEYRGDSWMNAAAESDVARLVELLGAEFATGDILMVGGSMGGTAALIFAGRRPGMLRAAVAFCPATDMAQLYLTWESSALAGGFRAAYGGTPDTAPGVYRERSSINLAGALARQPVYILHGEQDTLIPVQHSRLLARELVRQGAEFHYEEIPGGTHNSLITPGYLEKALTWVGERIGM
jgi:pimeloyl-ACP methyl ester carboxylesterase